MYADWNDFFVATAGAAAALLGLIFVSISFSLSKLLTTEFMRQMASQSLVLLLTALLIALWSLAPLKSAHWFSAGIVGLGLLGWSYLARTDVRLYRKLPDMAKRRHYGRQIVLNQVTTLPVLIGGCLCWEQGEGSVVWLVPGLLLIFLKAGLNAWGLLVEINR